MNAEPIFAERQKFTQWWLWLILIAINCHFIYMIIMQVFMGEPFGSRPISDVGLFIFFGISLLITYLFYSIRLETMIKTDGIYIRFVPFHSTYRFYSWDTMEKCYLRTYHPLREYGGWGIRIGLFGNGRAFNISGDQGLQLEFKNHDKLLIGTGEAEELRKALEKIGKVKG